MHFRIHLFVVLSNVHFSLLGHGSSRGKQVKEQSALETASIEMYKYYKTNSIITIAKGTTQITRNNRVVDDFVVLQTVI